MFDWAWFTAGFGAGMVAGLLTAWLIWLPLMGPLRQESARKETTD